MPNQIDYPTLEELFGNMDFCSCEHCKSVLSPAAYLVELLQFISIGTPSPLSVLNSRRPDIEHLQLSCENTNVSLPYVDIVNEIMEFYVVNGNLNTFKEQDIPEGTKSEDLIADPMFINENAYSSTSGTNSKVYPYNLPFDQPLETLRLIFNAWGLSLAEGIQIFDGFLSSHKEVLGLNNQEYRTLTDTGFHFVQEYFGEPGTAAGLANLNSDAFHAKMFCRRSEIKYDELVKLLKTNFLNPANTLIPKLENLKVNLDIINNWFNATINDNDFLGMLPSDLNLADYNNDVKQWLIDNRTAISSLILLKIISPTGSDCDFGNLKLKYALPNPTSDTLTTLDYHKFHRFIRLWKKLGWSIETIDSVLTILASVPSENLTENNTADNIDTAFITLLKRIANFCKLMDKMKIKEKKFAEWLQLWDTSTSDKLLLLAKLLKMPLADIIDIQEITGIDPLATDLETDEPALLRFLKILEILKASSIKIVDINYILRNKDNSGKLIPGEELLLNNIRDIREALAKIEAENSVAPDNADMTSAKTKMALVYDKNVVDNFFGFLTNQNQYSAVFNVTVENLPTSFASYTNLSYDPFTKSLSYRGVLSASELSALTNAANGLVSTDISPTTTATELASFKADFIISLGELSTKSNNEFNDFFITLYPELKTVYDAVIPLSAESQPVELINLIMPELKHKLKFNSVKQLLSGMLGCDIDILDTLLLNIPVVHSSNNNLQNIFYDLLELEAPIIFNNNQTYDFFLIPPATDNYNIYIQAPSGTNVALSYDGSSIVSGSIGLSGEINNPPPPLPFKAGSMLKFQLIISSLPANETVKIYWRTKGMAKQQIPDKSMLIKGKADFAKTSYIRLYKSVKIRQLLNLTPVELTYFSSQHTSTIDVLNNLDTDGTISTLNLHSIWVKFYQLVTFVNIKSQKEPEENMWQKVIANPATQMHLLISINNWNAAYLGSVLDKLSNSTNSSVHHLYLSDLNNLKKVLHAMNFVHTINFPAGDIITWITGTLNAAVIQNIKDSIKSVSDPAIWRSTLQSINDLLRNRQRDALISFILHHSTSLPPEIDTADKLYEYFLIDVQMDSCMKTSRIRMALSSVQLFIMRCLMNLEPQVSSTSIRAKEWEWMKRYRVWEANRKVFLYPENWLEPELRDNKSQFYRELEGELLQADITSELAETSFLNYLKKLDDVAKLEIAGMYLQENLQGNQNDDILHVFARTNGTTRQYYYRRYEYGYWTAWEKVVLNIEGNYVFPIIWKSRLFLFWLNIHTKPGGMTKTKTLTQMADEQWGDNTKVNVEINLSWGEYYKGKWTSPKSSEISNPIRFNNLISFDERKLWWNGSTKKNGNISERLIFNIGYDSTKATATFTNKNTPPVIAYNVPYTPLERKYFDVMTCFLVPISHGWFEVLHSGNMLAAQLLKEWNVWVFSADLGLTLVKSEQILKRPDSFIGDFRILLANTPYERLWEAPIFYDDERSIFFVKPTEEITTILPFFNDYYDVGVVGRTRGIISQIFETNIDSQKSFAGGIKAAEVNQNTKVVLQSPENFQFGNTKYSAVGRVVAGPSTSGIK